jgi:hypothetical protein
MMTTMKNEADNTRRPIPPTSAVPHVGKTPSKTRMRIMIRIVPRDIAFPRFHKPSD